MEMLKLIAFDGDDLAVISTHMQDAVLLVGDINYRKKEQQFALLVNRFVWGEEGKKGSAPFQRRRSALHFDRVNIVTTHHIRQNEKAAVLNLLAIRFESDEGPSGRIFLSFSGGGVICLEVECIEAQLSDLGPAWSTKFKPSHDISDE